jgi:hypothetical protein
MRQAGDGHFLACHFPLIDADEVPVAAPAAAATAS